MKPMGDLCIASQTLAQSGTVTGTVSGNNTGGKYTVILETSAGDITVTYKIGYTDPAIKGTKDVSNATWITPDPSGAITNLTNVTANKVASLTTQVAEYIQFTLTENNSAASTVKLIVVADRSI